MQIPTLLALLPLLPLLTARPSPASGRSLVAVDDTASQANFVGAGHVHGIKKRSMCPKKRSNSPKKKRKQCVVSSGNTTTSSNTTLIGGMNNTTTVVNASTSRLSSVASTSSVSAPAQISPTAPSNPVVVSVSSAASSSPAILSTQTAASSSQHKIATVATSSSPAASPKPTAPTTPITVDRSGVGPFSGDGTWFDTGLGACGYTNSAADPIVAVSRLLFDNWPGYNGMNPNNNPICGNHLNITWGGASLVVEVVDRCESCAERSLDLSRGAFEHFASLDVGLFGGDDYTPQIVWSWVEGSGPLAQVNVN